MKIHLMRGGKPYRTTIARWVPLRFKEQADKTLDKSMGVITEVNEPTAWCSLAFWVPKADNICVWLVTDFTNMNRVVKWSIHPFPSITEILQANLADARVFAKLDTIHEYFQLALDEKSSMLTTFLLSQGKFRYLKASMGLNASSDEWCCHSDIIIHGLPWACKIMDDTLIWG